MWVLCLFSLAVWQMTTRKETSSNTHSSSPCRQGCWARSVQVSQAKVPVLASRASSRAPCAPPSLFWQRVPVGGRAEVFESLLGAGWEGCQFPPDFSYVAPCNRQSMSSKFLSLYGLMGSHIKCDVVKAVIILPNSQISTTLTEKHWFRLFTAHVRILEDHLRVLSHRIKSYSSFKNLSLDSSC